VIQKKMKVKLFNKTDFTGQFCQNGCYRNLNPTDPAHITYRKAIIAPWPKMLEAAGKMVSHIHEVLVDNSCSQLVLAFGRLILMTHVNLLNHVVNQTITSPTQFIAFLLC